MQFVFPMKLEMSLPSKLNLRANSRLITCETISLGTKCTSLLRSTRSRAALAADAPGFKPRNSSSANATACCRWSRDLFHSPFQMGLRFLSHVTFHSPRSVPKETSVWALTLTRVSKRDFIFHVHFDSTRALKRRLIFAHH